MVTNTNKLWKEMKNDKNKIFFILLVLDFKKETILETRKIISYSHEAFCTNEHPQVLGTDIQ